LADAGLWQVEFDPQCARAVSGYHGRDGARLLVAGRQQERGRAAVALAADDVEVRLRVRQIHSSVWSYAPAAVHVGVDERAEGCAALQRWVDAETQLAIKRQIWPLAGRRDDRVHAAQHMGCPIPRPVHLDLAVDFPERVDLEPAHRLERTCLHQGAQLTAQAATGW